MFFVNPFYYTELSTIGEAETLGEVYPKITFLSHPPLIFKPVVV